MGPFQKLMLQAKPVPAEPNQTDLLEFFKNPAFAWMQYHVHRIASESIDVVMSPDQDPTIAQFYRGQLIASERFSNPEFEDYLWAIFEANHPPDEITK